MDSGRRSIVWGGRRWWLVDGYWQNRRGELLHRAVYRARYGSIPAGHEIHHRDHDPSNFAPENLEAVTRSEHLKRHRGVGWRPDLRPANAGRVREQWAAREPHAVVCQGCGVAFSSTGTRATFCSGPCKMRFYKRTGVVVRERKGRYHRPPKPCPVCGVLFRASDPRAITCGRSCGWRYRRGDRSPAAS